MCGIVGYIHFKRKIELPEIIGMRDTLRHRGPDDEGAALFENDSIALGHRRLSFLDLSPAGRQPMCNEDETVWIILNGEIYNYVELRAELEKHHHIFKTRTDTEVVIHGYEQWGYEVVNHLKGMFAFGLLDLKRKKIFLARDRFGIKPLYYHLGSSILLFASELKAILNSREIPREIDFSSFADYFTYRYVPSPKTIWKDISKLPPACYLAVDYAERKTELKEYWKLSFADKRQNDARLAEEVGSILSKSVAIHARSEVPVGSFLSGGYDSSALIYYLTQNGFKP
ncbi:MAG TPA: asparagine synthase (glutamine-hydrolyzing), partial [Chitinophagales bacterium]|nr:asparagine synthase (glutamine-hydrolyzing) [Chitinophagales bacterium]